MTDIRSKEKLKNVVKDEVTRLFETILDHSQLACTNPSTYGVLRSRILRAGNNCIRDIHKKMEQYEVGFVPTSEDVIEIKGRKN